MRISTRRALAGLMLLSVAAIGQAPHLIHQGDGFVAGESFGQGVTVIPDVNNDGIPDFVVGAPNHVASNATAQGGIAYVLSGANWTTLYTFQGPANGAMLGRVVASAGDVDGDGIADILVAAPSTTPPLPFGPPPFTPAVFIYSGATGALIHQKPLGGQSALSQGQAAPLGDIDFDNHADFIVGSGDGGTSAMIYSGATGSVFRTHTAPVSGEAYGYAVTGLGDIDGDGVPDYAVGARLADAPGLTDCGAIYVYSGVTGNLLATNLGSGATDNLGTSLASVGDVNGDGVPDYVAGGTGSDGNGTDAGMVRMFSGATRLPLWTVYGEVPSEAIGRQVKVAGDVNGDGVPDVIVGVPGHDVPTTNCGAVLILDGRTGAELGRFTGFATGDVLGYAVGTAGDVDGDGFADVVIGAPRTDPPAVGTDTGSFYVVSFGAFLQSCASGNIGANVLTINGSAGAAPRRVDVGLGGAFTLSVAPTPNHTNVPFLVFGKVGVPSLAEMFTSVPQVGTMCFTPSVLSPTSFDLFLLADSFAPSDPLALIQGATPAPWSVSIPGGLGFPFQVAFQGVTYDGAYRVTNAVLLDVH